MALCLQSSDNIYLQATVVTIGIDGDSLKIIVYHYLRFEWLIVQGKPCSLRLDRLRKKSDSNVRYGTREGEAKFDRLLE